MRCICLEVPSVKTKVFVSYSRKDREAINRLYDRMTYEETLTVFRDTIDILPSEQWQPRLEKLILESDVILFALSPSSAVSQVCDWEIALAESLHKRIIPFVISDVDGKVPDAISKLNYIFATPKDDFEQAYQAILSAIGTDIEWIREHTRLGELADRWERAAKIGAQPLRSGELAAAELWLVSQPATSPQPTQLQRRYIYESRKAAARRQRILMSVALVAVLVIAVAAVFAWVQRGAAVIAREDAIQQRRGVQQEQSRLLAAKAVRLLDLGRADSALQLAQYALPLPSAGDDRPLVQEALDTFSRAYATSHVDTISSILEQPVANLGYGNALCAAHHREARLFAVCDGNSGIKLVRTQTDGSVQIFKIAVPAQVALAISPDATALATLSAPYLVRFFDIETLQQTGEIQVSSRDRMPLPERFDYFAPDNILMAGVSEGFLINIASRKIEPMVFKTARDTSDGLLAFLRDGTTGAVNGKRYTFGAPGGNGYAVLVQDAGHSIVPLNFAGSGAIGGIMQHPDQPFAAVYTRDGKVTFVDLARNMVTGQADVTAFQEGCFPAQKPFFLAMTTDALQLLDMTSGRVLWREKTDEGRSVQTSIAPSLFCEAQTASLVISRQGAVQVYTGNLADPLDEDFGFTHVATYEAPEAQAMIADLSDPAHLGVFFNDGSLRTWTKAPRTLQWQDTKPADGYVSGDVSTDGALRLRYFADGTLKLQNKVTQKMLFERKVPREQARVRLIGDKTVLMFTNQVQVLDRAGAEMLDLPLAAADDTPSVQLVGNLMLVGGGATQLAAYDLAGRDSVVKVDTLCGAPLSQTAHGSTDTLAVLCADGALTLWDRDAGTRRIPLDNRMGFTDVLAVAPDGSFAVFRDSTQSIWLQRFNLGHDAVQLKINGSVEVEAQKNRILFAANDDWSTIGLDLESLLQPKFKMRVSGGGTRQTAFIGETPYFASLSEAGVFRTVNFDTGAEIQRIDAQSVGAQGDKILRFGFSKDLMQVRLYFVSGMARSELLMPTGLPQIEEITQRAFSKGNAMADEELCAEGLLDTETCDNTLQEINFE